MRTPSPQNGTHHKGAGVRAVTGRKKEGNDKEDETRDAADLLIARPAGNPGEEGHLSLPYGALSRFGAGSRES